MNTNYTDRFFIKLLIVIGFILLLINCTDAPKSNIQQEWDYSGQEIQLVVTLFDNERQLNEFIATRFPETKVDTHVGFAVMSPNDTFCEVFTIRPERIDDSHTTTLGHEVLHCLYGRYHK